MLDHWSSRMEKDTAGKDLDQSGTTPGLAHDQAGFADLYRRHVTSVYRYLVIRTGNHHDAQDLTAQTFLAALESWTSYRGDGQFAAWLIGIARRKVADHFRKQQAMSAFDEDTHVTEAGPSPEDVVERRLEVGRVSNALRKLPPDRAEAVAMYAFGGLKYEEIGRAMDRSSDAAKMLVHRGLRDLRERLMAADR